MEEQWEVFVACTKAKADVHQKAARFWSKVDTGFGLSLILVSACTTAAALLSFIPIEAVAGFGAISTVLAATLSFLRPADKRNLHDKASRDFRSLMVQMISCETEDEYEKLWSDFNREIMEEPLVPKRFAAKTDLKFTMSPELRQVIVDKKQDRPKLDENDLNGNEQLANGLDPDPNNPEFVQSEASLDMKEMELSEFQGQNANTATETPLLTSSGC